MRIFSGSLRQTTRTRESSPSCGWSPTSMRMGVSSTTCPGMDNQRKDIYIEHRAGKAALLASWRKMTHPDEFL